MSHRGQPNSPPTRPVQNILALAMLALAFAPVTLPTAAHPANQANQALLTPAQQSSEHILLANGFAIDCDHHSLVNGKLRLYPHPDETEFLDLDASTVSAITPVQHPSDASSAAPVTVPQPDRIADPITDHLTPADLHQMLASAGSQHNLDADLLASVVQAESSGNPRAVSPAGATGLMQLMPQTARQLGVSNTFAPDQNIHGGAAYLDQMLARYHDNLALALAAYNAGPQAVDRFHGIPPYRETHLYVARVIHLFNQRVAARRAHPNQDRAAE